MTELRNIPDLTTREAAALLGVGKNTLDQWRHHGKGPAYHRLGGAIRYTKEDLLDFIERVEARPATS